MQLLIRSTLARWILWLRAGDNQRRPRFVDQDGIHFIDDRVVVQFGLRALTFYVRDGGRLVVALHAFREAELHVVAQVIEAELVVGAVSDIGVVALVALLIAQIVHDIADGHAERPVDARHPLGIALGQVIVDRDDVDALPFERVQIHGQRRDQRLAFSGFHFGDLAVVQHDATNQLDIKMPHVEVAASRLAHGGERRHQ